MRAVLLEGGGGDSLLKGGGVGGRGRVEGEKTLGEDCFSGCHRMRNDQTQNEFSLFSLQSARTTVMALLLGRHEVHLERAHYVPTTAQ